MISRTHRFRGRKNINAVYRHGTPTRGTLFNLRVLKKNEGSYRVAVVVSKKVAKSAVVRNRIRRKIYSCFNTPELKNLPPMDIIINVFSPAVATASQSDLLFQLQKQLNLSSSQNK